MFVFVDVRNNKNQQKQAFKDGRDQTARSGLYAVRKVHCSTHDTEGVSYKPITDLIR